MARATKTNKEVTEMNLRVFIASRNGVVGRVTQSTSLKYNEYTGEKLLVPATQKASTGINSLAVMVQTMRQIKQLKDEGTVFAEPVVIYNVGVVTDQIERGTFKYWLATGKRLSGEEVSATEIGLWTEFSNLYMELFLDVIVKNISSASLPRSTKFAVSQRQKDDNQIVAMLWDKLPKSGVGELEDDTAEAL